MGDTLRVLDTDIRFLSDIGESGGRTGGGWGAEERAREDSEMGLHAKE